MGSKCSPIPLLLTLACCGVALILGVRSEAQSDDDEVIAPILSVRAELDWVVLRSMLESPMLRGEIESQLALGPCWHLGFSLAAEHENGDRAYAGALWFRATGILKSVFYDYSSTSVTNPTVPPDSARVATAVVANPQGTYRIVLPDVICFDFLRFVLANTPEVVIDHLGEGTLVDLWVERDTTPQGDTLRLRLVFQGELSQHTLTVTAEHLGDLEFGFLSVE